MKDCNTEINNFLSHVNSILSHRPTWLFLDKTEETIEEWLQYHWEAIFEYELNNLKVEVLGPGADIHANSSRVTYPDCEAEFKVICLNKSEKDKPTVDLLSNKGIDLNEYNFDSFAHWDGSHYSLLGPLNSVLLENVKGEVVLLELKIVSFHLVDI